MQRSHVIDREPDHRAVTFPFVAPPSTAKSRRTHRSAPRHYAVQVRRPDPEVWKRALELADGDAHRIDVLDDGSVLVHNTRVR